MVFQAKPGFVVSGNKKQPNNKKERDMYRSIELDDFKSEILAEKRPVLFACLSRDFRFKEQKEVLESVSSEYGEALKVCLRDKESLGVFLLLLQVILLIL